MDNNLHEKQYSLEIGDGYSSSGGIPNHGPNNSPLESQKTTKKIKVILSDRDLEVLEFILEMKFATIDEVCEKFFKGSPEDSNVVGYWYAKKRLFQLEKAGYLGSTKQFSSTQKLYYAKMRAYLTLKDIFLEKTFPRPTGSIDGRTVNHDYLLLKLRLELEKRDQVAKWISDRSLKVETGNISKLGKSYTPDGVYTPVHGAPVAFELEISLKAKARYQDKVRRYVQWIREHRTDPESFKTVHYVVTKESVKKHLENFTAMYPNLFKIEMTSNYFKESVV